MKRYSVAYTERAKKQLKKLDRSTKILIKDWIGRNLDGTDDPRRHGKSLTGALRSYWRYRIGDYRMVAELQDNELIIVAISINHRRQVYTDK